MRRVAFKSFLGQQIRYAPALKLQEALVAARIASLGHFDTDRSRTDTALPHLDHDIVLLLEHSPVYTVGRRIRNSENTAEAERLKSIGADYHEVLRGGKTTFHGPGQLVAYPIVNLQDRVKRGVRCYVDDLEKVIMQTCWHYGIESRQSPDTGVWVGSDKIAAIGIQVSQDVTCHGFALNCNTDMKYFDHFVPCGLGGGKGVTSITRQLVRGLKDDRTVDDVKCEHVQPQVIKSFENVFQCQMEPLETMNPKMDNAINDFIKRLT